MESLNNVFTEHYEIIVSDWWSCIKTQKVVERVWAKYVKSNLPWRAWAMNYWASFAKWDVLLFLHADTILPKESKYILHNLDLNRFIYWWFYKKFKPTNYLLWLVAFFNNIRSEINWYLLWDNVMFFSKTVFDQVWWFPMKMLMEDIEMSYLMKKYVKDNHMKMLLIKFPCVTSSRKFLKSWVLRTLLFMQKIKFLHMIGTDYSKLKYMYKKFK